LPWPQGEQAFEALVSQSKSLAEIADQHRRDEQASGAFAGLHLEAPKLAEFWKAVVATGSTVLDARVAVARRRLENHPDWTQVDDEFRTRLQRNLAPTRPSEGIADAELSQAWLSAVNAVDRHLTVARDQLEAEAARLRQERARRIDEENRGGQRREEEFVFRVSRVLDSAAKIEALRRQLSDCETRMAQANLRIKTEFID
jgi:hypothetical protein